MKRILYSCLFFIFAQLTNYTFSQNFSIGYSFGAPGVSVQCLSSTGNTMHAEVIGPCPFATQYTWSAISSGPCTPTITNVNQFGVANNGTSVTIVFAPNCCGQFTIEATGLNPLLPPPSVVCGPGGGTGAASYTPQIICANSGVTLSPTNSIVCSGYPAVLSAVGGTAYTFTGPNTAPVNTVNNTPNFTVNPTSTTIYTLVGTTPQGCQAQTTQTVTVHSATISASPASQTICLGSVICFTAKAGAVTAGTSTYNVDWLAPSGAPPFANGLTTCTTAAGGTYSAVLSYSSSAVNCQITATANVSISTSINVNVPANFSMCPNNSTTLTASSIATNYTWTAPDGSTLTTNPAVVIPTVAGCYTVDADYSGCPGQNQVCISFYTLNPTLASSSPSSCPGQSHTLTATGGNEYTFYYEQTYMQSDWIAISTLSTTSTFTDHIPPSLPARYAVVSYSNGCTGSVTITLNAITLSPTVAVSTASVCPNTQFTLSAGNVGAGATYSFQAGYAPFMMTNGTNTFAPTFGGPVPSYYTYTVIADSANCQGKDSIRVYKKIQYPNLVASTPSVCPNTTFTLTETLGGAGTTYTFVADYLTAPGTSVIPNPPLFSVNNVTVKPTSVTPYRKYYVNVDSAGCKGTDTLRVYRLDLGTTINLHLNAPTNSVCPNNTFTLVTSSGPGTSVQIGYLGPPAVSLPVTVNSATHVLNPAQLAANGTYTVKADSSTCTGTSTLIVRKFKITPVLTATPNPVCSAIPVTLTTTGLTTATTTTFKFYESGTLLQSSQSPTYAANPGPTVNTTYVVVADSSNCIDSANVLVTISPSLVLNPSSSTPTICSGVNFTLSVSGPPNALYYWYEPTSTGSNQIAGPLTISQASDGIVPPNMTVTTTYTVHAVDPAGCDGYAFITVSVNPGAQLTLTVSPQNATICPGQQDTLYASGAVNYTWSPSGNLSPNAFTYSVVAAPPATQVYTVIGNNGFGCFGRATSTLYVGSFPKLSVTAVPAWSICPGFTSTLTAFGANSYTWTGPTPTNVVMQQSIAAVTGDCFTLTGSNGGSCISFSPGICIDPAPPLVIKVVSANNIYTTCIESNTPKFSKPVILNASGAGSYVWFPYNPIHMTYSIGPSTTVRPPTTTNYTVIGNTSICSGSAAVTVSVIQQFTMGVSPPLPAICLGDTISLKPINVSTLAVGPPSKFSYFWAEAGNAPPISISSYFAPTVQVHPENTTTYTLEIADARGCYSIPRLITVSVLPRPLTSVAIPTINGVPTRSLCFVGLNPGPPDVVLTLVANNDNTNLQFGVVPTYTWYAPYKDHNSILTPPNNNQIIVNAPVRTPASVVYTVISGFNGVPGCYTRDTVHISVVDCRPIKKVLFTTAETLDTICAQECVTFVNLTDTMAGNPQKVEWVFRGGNPPVSTYSAPTVCYNLPGRYDVILKVENPYPLADGGSSLAIGQLSYIKVVDVPNITIVPPGNLRSDTTVRFGTSVALKASGGLTYNWSPNYNISSLSNANVTVKPFRTTQYILTGFNSKRCASRDTINVIVIEDCGEMYVPNAFSPNGDGHNDVLKVNGICLQTMTFMIFNRWGEKIFETNEQNVGWDGTYKGDEMNSGVFVYRLEGKTYDGKAYSSKGNITLIR